MFWLGYCLEHSCQIYKRGKGEEKRGKKGAKKGQKRGIISHTKSGNALRATFSDEQLLFYIFHISNAENLNNIEGTGKGFSRRFTTNSQQKGV